MLAGLGVAAVGGAAAAAVYRISPMFWKQWARDLSRDIDPAPRRPLPSRWDRTGAHVAWLGHATMLIRLDGYTILTDPVFSDRAGLHFGPLSIGVKRLVKPALAIEDLPKIDLILLSHAHMDHMDVPSLRALENKGTRVVAAHATSDLLRAGRYARVDEMRWNDRLQAGPVSIRAIEVNHWGARLRTDTWRGYNGYLLEAAGKRILFPGDTAATDSFRALRTARELDLAIMPIGAYNPWIRAHCTPEQAWQMGNQANAARFLPIHHQTFRLSNEPKLEPIERFLRAAGRDDARIAAHEIGAEFSL